MIGYLLLGAGLLYIASRSSQKPSASSVGLGASESDKALLTDSPQGLAYKPEVVPGVLNSLLTKAIVTQPGVPFGAAGAAQLAQLVEMGDVMDATRSAYLLAKMIHEAPGDFSLWVTPRLTEAAKPGTPMGFLYWGQTPPKYPGTWALLVPAGIPWPGKPPIGTIPVGPGGPPTQQI